MGALDITPMKAYQRHIPAPKQTFLSLRLHARPALPITNICRKTSQRRHLAVDRGRCGRKASELLPGLVVGRQQRAAVGQRQQQLPPLVQRLIQVLRRLRTVEK